MSGIVCMVLSLAVLVHYWQTHKWHDNSTYHASIVSHSKNKHVHACDAALAVIMCCITTKIAFKNINDLKYCNPRSSQEEMPLSDTPYVTGIV